MILFAFEVRVDSLRGRYALVDVGLQRSVYFHISKTSFGCLFSRKLPCIRSMKTISRLEEEKRKANRQTGKMVEFVLIFNLQSGRPTTKGSFKYISRRYAAPLASCISFHAIFLLRLFGLNGGALWCAVRCGLCIYRHYETLSSNLMDDVHEKDVEMHRNLRNLAFATAAAAFFLLYLLLLLIIVVLLNATLSKRLLLLLLNTIMQMMQMAQNALFPSHSIITLHYVFHRSKCFYSCGHQKFWNEVKI